MEEQYKMTGIVSDNIEAITTKWPLFHNKINDIEHKYYDAFFKDQVRPIQRLHESTRAQIVFWLVFKDETPRKEVSFQEVDGVGLPDKIKKEVVNAFYEVFTRA